MQQNIGKSCDKRKIYLKLGTLELIDPESIKVNPVVDSVLFGFGTFS